jgi:hypothetical protein
MKPYECDPEYEAAHDAYVRSYPNASAGLTARANAAATMHRIQAAYEADPSQFRRYESEAWAATEAAKLPPFTQTEIGVVAAIARQIDERMAEAQGHGNP